MKFDQVMKALEQPLKEMILEAFDGEFGQLEVNGKNSDDESMSCLIVIIPRGDNAMEPHPIQESSSKTN